MAQDEPSIREVLQDKKLFSKINAIAKRDGISFNDAMKVWYAER